MAGVQTNAIAQVYAGALLDVATDANVVSDVQDQLLAIGEVVKSDSDFANFIQSPVIGINKKKASLNTIFASQLSDLVLNFLMVLTDKGRLMLLLPIVEAFGNLQDERAGRVSGTVTTAVAINDADLSNLTAQISKRLDKTVTLTPVVDAEILGGFVLNVEGTLIDGSVKRGLKRAKDQLAVASTGAAHNATKYFTE